MKYKAFISYRHCQPDSAAAKKIINIVETYGIPKTIIEKHHTDKRVGRLFRDEDELSASANLSKTITDALEDSEYLIAVCSPEYVQSQWCMLEINYWLEHKDKEKIIVVLLKGEPSEAFPSRLTEDGEPLAIDIRGSSEKEILNNIKAQKLRFVAALISCDYDDLRQRDKEQARHNRAVSIGAVMAVISVFSAAIAILQTKANNELNEKNLQIEEQIVQINAQNNELNLKNSKIEEQVDQINRKNTELEEQNNEMKLLSADICRESAAFLAKNNLYDDAARKIMEGIELCRDVEGSTLDETLAYELMDYMNLYDPEKKLNKTGSLTLSSYVYPSFSAKGSTLMHKDSDFLIFYDLNTCETITSVEYYNSDKKNPTLLDERRYMYTEKNEDGRCVLTAADIYDGTACSYTFDEGIRASFDDIAVRDDRIILLQEEKYFVFDFSCNMLSSGTAEIDNLSHYKEEMILNTDDLIFIADDEILIYDTENQSELVRFEGDNNNIYTSPSPHEYTYNIHSMRPVLFGDTLFYSAYDPENDVTGIAAAQVGEGRLRGIAKNHTDNNYHSDSCPEYNRVICTSENEVHIMTAGEDLNNCSEITYTLFLSESDYIVDAKIGKNAAAVVTNEGKVFLYFSDGSYIQFRSYLSGNYARIKLTDDRLFLIKNWDAASGKNEVEIYSCSILDNAEGYMKVYGSGTPSVGINLDNTICVKYHDSTESDDWIYDAQTCTLKFHRNEKDDGSTIYGGYAPVVENNTIIGKNPSKYAVYDYSSLTGAEDEEPRIIEWEEQFRKTPDYNDDAYYSYQYTDGEYAYFVWETDYQSHGEKYSLSDGSLAEDFDFLSETDAEAANYIKSYRIYGNVRAELSSQDILNIFKDGGLTDSYKIRNSGIIPVSEDKLCFIDNNDDVQQAVIYSLSECRELFRSEAFNGTEDTYSFYASGADCSYGLIGSRFLADLNTMTVIHDFGGTFIDSSVSAIYYNEYLELFGILRGSDMIYFDPVTFEERFTVNNVYGASPDGKYIFVRADSASFASDIIKLKMFTVDEVLEKAKELYGEADS